MDTTLTLPTDYAGLINLLVNPLTIGILLSWFIGHLPIIKNDNITNWIKFVLSIVICLVWSALVTLVKSGIPSTPQAWYVLIYTGLAVAFSNQAFYRVVKALPGIGKNIGNWLLLLFGKSNTTSFTATISEKGMKPTPPTITVRPSDIVDVKASG